MSALPFTLRQLEYAVAVDDHASFSRAAEHCHVSQPSLSAQIQQLEDALGVRLFERSKRKVLRTRAGEALLPRAREALLSANTLVTAAESLQDPFAGIWRIGVIATVAPYFLPKAAPALTERYPKLAIRWTEGLTRDIVPQIENGDLEAAVLALEADLGDLERTPILKDEFVLAVSAQHRLAKGKSRVRGDVLDDERVLLLDDGHCLRDQAIAYCSTKNATELGFRATSLPTLTEMVVADAGVTLLPELALDKELRGRRLTCRRFVAPAPFRTIGLVWRKGSALADAFEEVAGTLKKHLAQERSA